MKQVYSNKMLQYIYISIALGFDILGIASHVLSTLLDKDIITIYGAIIVFPLISLIFWFGYYIEKHATLVIDIDTIPFHYYVSSKPKIKYSLKKGLKIHIKDIRKVYIEFYKGDVIFISDTIFSFIILNNDTKIQTNIHRLGKKKEKKIYEVLNKLVHTNKEGIWK